MKVIGQFLGCWLLVVALCGCQQRERQRQNELESFTAATLQKFLSLLENRAAEPLTNVAQIFEMMDLTRAHRAHPYVLQQKFREFGANAGFTNSIYEKYVILPPGLTNDVIRGELIVMSTQSFPDLEGRSVRMIIWKAGPEDYRQTQLSEAQVSNIFAEANLPIPKTVASPPPPPSGDYELTYSATARIRMFFQELAEVLGLGKMFWLPLMLICAIVAATAVIFSILIVRRNR